jgi:hypothetical protein
VGSDTIAPFTSRVILPVSSTMQALVSLAEKKRQVPQNNPSAVLLLMFEAASTKSFDHQPEAHHLKSPAIHKLPDDYPI